MTLPLSLTGIRAERRTERFPVLTHGPEDPARPLATIHVALALPLGAALPTFSAAVVLAAQFTGAQRVMYYWRVPAAVLAILLLTVVQTCCFIGYLIWRGCRRAGREEEGEVDGMEEYEEESDSDDSQNLEPLL